MQVLIHSSDRLKLFVFEFTKFVYSAEVNLQKKPVAQFVSLNPLLCDFVPMAPVVRNRVEILPLTVLCQGEAKFFALLANYLDSSRLIFKIFKGLAEPHKLVFLNDLGNFVACLYLLAKCTSPAIHCFLEHSLVMTMACNCKL